MEVNMKNKKWLWWALTIILTLIVLAGVGFAGFRVGVAQAVNLPDGMSFMHGHARGFDGNVMHDGFGGKGFDHGGRDFGGRGGFSFFSPLFGLIRLAVLGGLIWLGYTFVKRSGWRVVNVNASQPSAPVETEVEEKKDEA
jgi:hypothetical protein